MVDLTVGGGDSISITNSHLLGILVAILHSHPPTGFTVGDEDSSKLSGPSSRNFLTGYPGKPVDTEVLNAFNDNLVRNGFAPISAFLATPFGSLIVFNPPFRDGDRGKEVLPRGCLFAPERG